MKLLCGLLTAGAIVFAAAASEAQGRITVTGTGEVARAPDMAVLRLGASFEAATAGEAMDLVAGALDGTIAALRATGVGDMGHPDHGSVAVPGVRGNGGGRAEVHGVSRQQRADRAGA